MQSPLLAGAVPVTRIGDSGCVYVNYNYMYVMSVGALNDEMSFTFKGPPRPGTGTYLAKSCCPLLTPPT